jgi:phage/plasmid-associated DNA primase
VPFNARIQGPGEVKNYANVLFEQAGGAILAWMIDGARKFVSAGYRVELPDCVKTAIEKYQSANDWLSTFLAEKCEAAQRWREPAGRLYRHYREYCNQTGEYVRSAADFKAALEQRGFGTKRTNTGVFVLGLRVRPDALTGDPEPEGRVIAGAPQG